MLGAQPLEFVDDVGELLLEGERGKVDLDSWHSSQAQITVYNSKGEFLGLMIAIVTVEHVLKPNGYYSITPKDSQLHRA